MRFRAVLRLVFPKLFPVTADEQAEIDRRKEIEASRLEFERDARSRAAFEEFAGKNGIKLFNQPRPN